MYSPNQGPIREVAALFLKLGTTAFGGPAAHIAMMRDEVVTRRGWMSDQAFLDLVGATNLIPGPNSTEMAIHLGYLRAGWRGLILAGVLFILPAMLIVWGLAVLYTRYGALPEASALLYGIKPVIIAVVAQALWGLFRTAVRGPALAVVGVAVLVLYLLRFNEIALLVAGGVALLLLGALRGQLRTPAVALAALPAAVPSLAALQTAAPYSLGLLFLLFLKIGSVLYGSGYVLLAFLRNDFVNRLGWLTDQQLLDAVAVGQLTPGPVFTTATFIGYIVGGTPGALVATVGIFLPSFIFVWLLRALMDRLQASKLLRVFLDGVNVASLGLMAGVLWELTRAAVVDIPTALVAIVSAVLLIRYKINTTWLIAGGALVGLVRLFLVG
jgi:chromate transporter